MSAYYYRHQTARDTVGKSAMGDVVTLPRISRGLEGPFAYFVDERTTIS